jgi:hypothetical protein
MKGVRAPAGVAAALLGAAALACARPGTPRGGPEDRRPPVVIEAEPTPLATVTDPNAPIRFRFSERISERPSRGVLDEAVIVSPMTGTVQVDHGSEELRVYLEGGLLPGLVYRVTVLPVIVDLFSNRMSEPFEIAFSTGGELSPNAVAGQVLDRITGRPTPDAVVALLPPSPVSDTLRYVARSDQNGLFFFRYLPEARFALVAFDDRNRNLTPDPSEAQGSRPLLVQGQDTLLTDITVLVPDTTPAQLVRAELADSSTLRLVFTDYLDPENVARVVVEVEPLEEGRVPEVTGVMHPDAWEALQDSLAAARDTTERDPQEPVSRVPRPGETMATPGQERGGLPGGLPLPQQELIATLDEPLAIGRPYRVTSARVINVNGTLQGGGQDTIVRPQPPPRPAADSSDVAPRGADPDRRGAPPDTLEQPADTTRLGFRARAFRRRR